MTNAIGRLSRKRPKLRKWVILCGILLSTISSMKDS